MSATWGCWPSGNCSMCTRTFPAVKLYGSPPLPAPGKRSLGLFFAVGDPFSGAALIDVAALAEVGTTEPTPAALPATAEPFDELSVKRIAGWPPLVAGGVPRAT